MRAKWTLKPLSPRRESGRSPTATYQPALLSLQRNRRSIQPTGPLRQRAYQRRDVVGELRFNLTVEKSARQSEQGRVFSRARWKAQRTRTSMEGSPAFNGVHGVVCRH